MSNDPCPVRPVNPVGAVLGYATRVRITAAPAPSGFGPRGRSRIGASGALCRPDPAVGRLPCKGGVTAAPKVRQALDLGAAWSGGGGLAAPQADGFRLGRDGPAHPRHRSLTAKSCPQRPWPGSPAWPLQSPSRLWKAFGQGPPAMTDPDGLRPWPSATNLAGWGGHKSGAVEHRPRGRAAEPICRQSDGNGPHRPWRGQGPVRPGRCQHCDPRRKSALPPTCA